MAVLYTCTRTRTCRIVRRAQVERSRHSAAASLKAGCHWMPKAVPLGRGAAHWSLRYAQDPYSFWGRTRAQTATYQTGKYE